MCDAIYTFFFFFNVFLEWEFMSCWLNCVVRGRKCHHCCIFFFSISSIRLDLLNILLLFFSISARRRLKNSLRAQFLSLAQNFQAIAGLYAFDVFLYISRTLTLSPHNGYENMRWIFTFITWFRESTSRTLGSLTVWVVARFLRNSQSRRSTYCAAAHFYFAFNRHQFVLFF